MVSIFCRLTLIRHIHLSTHRILQLEQNSVNAPVSQRICLLYIIVSTLLLSIYIRSFSAWAVVWARSRGNGLVGLAGSPSPAPRWRSCWSPARTRTWGFEDVPLFHAFVWGITIYIKQDARNCIY